MKRDKHLPFLLFDLGVQYFGNVASAVITDKLRKETKKRLDPLYLLLLDGMRSDVQEKEMNDSVTSEEKKYLTANVVT